MGIIAAAAGIPTLSHAILSDEYEYIFAAHNVQTFSDVIQNILTSEIGEFWRPTIHLSFFLDYQMFHLNSWGYHLTNAILHITSSILIALITKQLLKSFTKKQDNSNLSILAGIIFAIFPNHHEAVTWLAGRTDLLATTLYLAAIATWLSVFTNKNKTVLKIVSFTLLTLLALGAKEIAITIPIIISIISFFIYKKEKSEKKNIFITTSIALTSLATYLFARTQFLGSISGGYDGNSSLIADFFTTESIIRILKTPITILQYSLNLKELSAYISPTRTDLLTAAITIILIIAAIILFQILTKKKKTAILAIIAGLAWIYITALPMFQVLKSLNYTLESTRYLYLPSAGMAIIIAATIASTNHLWKKILTSLTLLGLTIMWLINVSPWIQASNAAESITDEIKNAQINQQNYLAFNNIPDNINGAFIFRRGLSDMINIYHPNIPKNHIAQSGRGIGGTHFDSCIQNLDQNLLFIDIDQQTGIVKNTQTIEPTNETQNLKTINLNELLKTSEENIDYQNIEKQENKFKVTGKNPYIRVKNLNINSREIEKIQTNIEINNSTESIWHLYWKTEEFPTEHEFSRHIIIPSKESATFNVCQYPAFYFANTITSLRINIPLKSGEEFEIIQQ